MVPKIVCPEFPSDIHDDIDHKDQRINGRQRDDDVGNQNFQEARHNKLTFQCVSPRFAHASSGIISSRLPGYIGVIDKK